MKKSRVVPIKVLLALTLAVLLAHLAVLRTTAASVGLNTAPVQPQLAPAFTTRTVERTPATPPAAAQPAASLVAASLKSKKVPPAPTRPQQRQPGSQPESSAAMTSPLPSPALEAHDNPDPNPNDPAPAAPVPAQAAALAEQPVETVQLPSVPRPPREVAPPLSSPSLPGSTRLKYTVQTNKFPFSLNSELLWQHQGERYEARLEYSAFGQARVQTSRGAITAQGLAPLRFSDKFRTEVAAHFNREQGKVTFSANTPDVPLLAGAQDRLSILVQLAALLASAPEHYPEATTLAIQAIGPRDADTWLFTVGRAETLTLPGGEQATLKLVRNPRREFDQRVELWLAPALGYLPARIRITEPNGDYVDQKWAATEPQI